MFLVLGLLGQADPGIFRQDRALSGNKVRHLPCFNALPGNKIKHLYTLLGIFLRIGFSPPPPTPEFLTKDFPSATRSRMEVLTKENLVGAKTAPTAVSKTFTPLVRGIRFP